MSEEKQSGSRESRFAGQVAAVTGSAGGIGRNIARAFGREEARVIICDIDKDRGLATVSELRQQGISAEFLYVDLSKRNAPQAMVQDIVRRWGKLDILVNNARSGKRTDFLAEDEDTWEEGMSVTLRAAFFASQEAIRVMAPKGGGSIVNISSVSASAVGAESAVYHIAKAGLIQATRYLAAHAGNSGVRVNAVLPGFIVQDEDQARYSQDDNQHYREIAEFCHPLKSTGRSNDVAEAVLFLSSPEASFITGECLVVDGGLTLQDQSYLIYRFAQNRKWNTET